MNSQSTVQTWQLPSMSASGHSSATPVNLGEVDFEKGFAKGLAQGRIEGEAAATAKLAQAQACEQQQSMAQYQAAQECLALFEAPYTALTQVIEIELVAVIRAVASKLYQRAIAEDSEQLVALIQRAKSQLPLVSQTLRVNVAPSTCERIKKALAAAKIESSLEVLEDADLQEGEFVLQTDDARIDGTLSKRLDCLLTLDES